MKVLVVNKDKSLSIENIKTPKPKSHQALVKILSCGICNGTDIKLIHGTFKGYDDSLYPIILGHEAVGQVIEIGDHVSGLKIGDTVLLPFNEDTEIYHAAWGGFAEYGIVNDFDAVIKLFPEEHELIGLARSQTVIPGTIDPVYASMIITLREVLSSIKRFGITEKDSIVIFGCGPVGQTFIRFLSLLGVDKIIAIDIIDAKLVLAKNNGAKYTFNSKKVNIEEEVKQIFSNGVDFVLDAVGISEIINQAMALIRDQGSICCYGISPNTNANIDWRKAPYNWKLHFQQFPSKNEEGLVHEQIMEWINHKEIDLQDFVSNVYSFNEIIEAFNQLENRNIPLKGVVKFE